MPWGRGVLGERGKGGKRRVGGRAGSMPETGLQKFNCGGEALRRLNARTWAAEV